MIHHHSLHAHQDFTCDKGSQTKLTHIDLSVNIIQVTFAAANPNNLPPL